MLLGHWIEMQAVGNAGNALQKMAELLPGSVHLADESGNIIDVPLQQVQTGRHVIVKAGEKIPTDGKIIAGETTVNDNHVAGLVAQGDDIKPEAKTTVEHLKQMNIVPVMLTGDNEGYARSVAAQVGISHIHAGLLPGDKEKMIVSYQEGGKPVMMVGDGVNDAPALARADIGVAIGAGTDVAIDSADVVLVKSNPSDILHFFSLAKNTTKKMHQNLWWGAGYNIIAIPLAAGVLASVGIILSPSVGAILMSVSTVVVAMNALTLRMK